MKLCKQNTRLRYFDPTDPTDPTFFYKPPEDILCSFYPLLLSNRLDRLDRLVQTVVILHTWVRSNLAQEVGSEVGSVGSVGGQVEHWMSHWMLQLCQTVPICARLRRGVC